MALQLCSSSSSLLSLCSLQLLRLSPIASPSDQFLKPTIMPQGILKKKKQKHSLLFCRSSNDESNEDYYLDAPVSVGDGFSFSGGKYSDEPSPADEWFEQGKIVKAHPVGGTGDKAKDPIFGLAMGGGSQTSSDLFRDYRLKHALSAYSYRKVLPILSKKYHAIAFDWLGFGFSDKPQPRYGFDYTLDGTCIQNPGRKSLIFVLTKKLNLVTLKMDSVCSNYCMPCMVAEYTTSLESIIDETTKGKATLVVQGYFSPVVVKYASSRQEKITDLILLNPPLTAKHANLPSTLSIFSNFLLGEIFSQDPLRASDKALTSCGPYVIKEDVAMVYRRPYLTSGSAGFALNAISRAMKKELKPYIEEMRRILMDENWQVNTTIIWGERDRWLSYNGVEEFCIESKHRLIRLPMVISCSGLATLRPKLQYCLAN